MFHCLKVTLGCSLKHRQATLQSTHSGLSHEAAVEPLSDTLQVKVDAHQAELPAPLD